ncbi:sensor histidine kinase [Streptomyces sp. WMMB 322]|uniref:sensor histidine kinase n=1 Tax=Streptomyces sp. WMMB 322 TaxID=1286821 RepID=UPI0006E31DA8|nr:histidine kinase [Streptomyces sp. WMMB 322]SCK55398.1 Signal transduction histidine kinase [Streptomyces sp. WMMB 322]
MPHRRSALPPPWVRPHRDGVLIALAGLVGGVTLWWFGLYNNPRVGGSYGAWLLLPLVAVCIAALGRRSAQPWALVVAVAALAADLAMGSLLATVIVFTDVVYAAVLYGPPRLSRALLPACVAVSVAATLVMMAVLRTPATLLLGVFCAGITVVPAWSGVVIRDHRNAAAAERLRAEQTALLAEMDRVQAVTAERGRMARELHDLVANHLSAIAIRSTAALSLEHLDDAAARASLGVVRENSVQGLAEMRRLIGLLRDASVDAAEPAASPTLAGLDALIERARAGAGNPGLSFSLRDERGPAGASLPAPVELAAYRVVQESVTNALKHSAPGTVTVELRHTPARGPLTVRVTSPLHGVPGGGREALDAAPLPRAPGSGAGLIGMRERVELLGGALSAGPAEASCGETGIWEVRAELPVGEGSLR